jgi:hypothetical protein
MSQHSTSITEITANGMSYKVVVDMSTDEENFSAHVIFSKDGSTAKGEDIVWETQEALPIGAPSEAEMESLMNEKEEQMM